jgi:NAD(P)-dependent dehydrogenase (short-subunit alcohol dehydrogenase family)
MLMTGNEPNGVDELTPIGKLADVPLSALAPYVQTNLLSTIFLIQAALPHLRRNGSSSAGSSDAGRIVLVSSGASSTGYVGWGLYSMVKAAGNSLCRTLAAEEKGNGVAVWSIRPGVVNVSKVPMCTCLMSNSADDRRT